MKVLFLDESGDHNLTVIDPQYPLFILGGVILEKDYAENELDERLNRFKRELFGRADIVLHTADIVRNRNGFERMQDAAFRIVGLNLRAKSDNLAGLQLADLVVSPIGRHVLGKPEKEDFRVVRDKFRRDRSGKYEGFGLVVLPQ